MKFAMRIYRRHFGWIVLIGFIFAAAMGVYTYYYEPDIYASSVDLYVLPQGENADAQYNPETSEMLVRDSKQLIRGPEVMREANEKLWPDSLDGVRILLEGIEGTHIIRITAYGADPSLCQRAVIAVNAAFMEKIKSVAKVETVYVADRAELPESPAGPARLLKIALSFGIAFLVTSILWLLFAPKKRKLTAFDAAGEDFGVPVIGSISDYRQDLTVFAEQRDDGAGVLTYYINPSTIEDVKALSIAFSQKTESSVRSLLFTSYQADEGKSTLAAILASELASQGKRVLLVDMDCYAPTLSALFGTKGMADIFHYFSGQASLDQVILPTAVPNLFLIDNLHPGSSLMRLTGTPEFADFLEQMYLEFDYVFFDAPPVELFADAAALGNVLDGTLLVVAQGRLRDEQLQDMKSRLTQAGNHLCGMVFNFVKPRKVKQYREYEDSPKMRRIVAG